MKKGLILLVTTFIILSISPNKAFATYLEPYLGPYMTDESSTTLRDTFDLHEEPFAYIGFDVIDLNSYRPLELTWSWYFDTDMFVASESQRISHFDNPFLDIWNSLDDWDNYARVGDWRTVISWENDVLLSKGGWGSQTVNFTVNPEPVSSVLFLIGGATLAVRHYRKKRKIS